MVSKGSLCKEVAVEQNIPEKTANAAVSAFLSKVKDEVAKGNSVTLVGFGTFRPAEYAARKGRNPSTGEEITISGGTAVRFKPSEAFKSLLN